MSQYTIGFNYMSSKPLAKSPFHSHPSYEIYYFQGGRCNYLIGDRIHVLEPGDMFLMHGMTLHRPHIYPGEPYVRTIIHFEPSYVEGLIKHSLATDLMAPFRELRNHLLPHRGEARLEVEELLRRMAHFYHPNVPRTYDRFLVAFLDLLLLIHECCERPLEELRGLPTEKERHVQNIISFIQSNFPEDINLDVLEKELHLSKYYLTRIFKDVTGVTIFTYLFQRRINEAKVKFLMNSFSSVSEVGYEVGFKHPAHFSRVFKEQVGMTPEKFRQQMRTNHNES
jgi:AraC-like DNA-binding protein